MKSDPERGSIKAAPLLFSCRLTLFIVCMVSSFVFLLQRMNISFALVCMVKRPNGTLALPMLESEDSTVLPHDSSSFLNFSNFNDPKDHTFNTFIEKPSVFLGESSDSSDDVCKRLAANRSSSSTEFVEDKGEFDWSKDVQGQILSAFFYGYLFTQIFGGWLAERFGAKLAFLTSVACLSIFTLMIPVAAHRGPEFLFAVRLLMGLTHGAALPAVNIFAARWCSPQERGMLMGIAYGGFVISAATTFPICAFLCENFGWEFIFYVTGLVGIIFLLISYFLVYDWPETHPRISSVELEYLRKTRSVPYSSSRTSQKVQVPWRSIVTSLPINVIHITHTCFTWGFLMVGLYMPTFLKEVLYMDTTQNGLFSSLPYFGMLSVHFLVGSIFDFFRRKNCCSVSVLRKVFNTFGMLGPAISLAITGFLSCTNIEFGIALITVGQTFGEFAFMGGYMLSIFELAPKYAGVIIGITNTFGVLPGFLCPLLVSFATSNGTRDEWILVFCLAAAFNIFGTLLYLFFGSCELQPWAITPERDNSIAASEMKTINGDFHDSLAIHSNKRNGSSADSSAPQFHEKELVPLTFEPKN